MKFDEYFMFLLRELECDIENKQREEASAKAIR